MSIKKEDIVTAIESMPVKEVVELISALEEKFGVSAAQMMAAPAAAAPSGEQAEEKTEFSVILKSFGEKKVAVIKEVRAITGLGLKEAKELVEGDSSVVKEGINKEDAEKIKKQLENAGATVELK